MASRSRADITQIFVAGAIVTLDLVNTNARSDRGPQHTSDYNDGGGCESIEFS